MTSGGFLRHLDFVGEIATINPSPYPLPSWKGEIKKFGGFDGT
jgi:hypothetical protein